MLVGKDVLQVSGSKITLLLIESFSTEDLLPCCVFSTDSHICGHKMDSIFLGQLFREKPEKKLPSATCSGKISGNIFYVLSTFRVNHMALKFVLKNV